MLDSIFIKGSNYLPSEEIEIHISKFKKMYGALEKDPYTDKNIGKRAYSRYDYDQQHGLTKSNKTGYFQTYDSNNVDSGTNRLFIEIPDEINNNNLFKKILLKDIELIKDKTARTEFTIGVHLIRYLAKKYPILQLPSLVTQR